jgi:hypothetical protein
MTTRKQIIDAMVEELMQSMRVTREYALWLASNQLLVINQHAAVVERGDFKGVNYTLDLIELRKTTDLSEPEPPK